MTLGERALGQRVSIVLHSFDRGGSGRVAGYLARGFADLGMVVDLVVFRPGGPVEPAVLDLIGPDLPVRYLGPPRGPRPLELARGLPALVRTLRRERPDVVVAAANNTALITAIAFRLAWLPASRLYLKTTNPIASSRHRGVVRWLRRVGYRLIFAWTTRVLTLSVEESREMDDAFPAFAGLFRDVRNPYVASHMLVPTAARQPESGRAKTIITVARLDRQKRLERLVAAFAEVADQQARLLILGEGEERTALAALVARLGLQRRVAMPGHVRDVVPALQAADLFVLTSDYEGLPAVVLEAMATNCPVLSTPCFPSARALLTAAEGCSLIEDPEPSRLARLIDTLLLRPRPTTLRAIAAGYSISAGVASHAEAILTR